MSRTADNMLYNLRKNRPFASRFGRDEGGSLIIFSLFMLILMLMISGMAVDLMRAETHRARLQSTLDRAILAAASLEQTLNSEEVVLDYFDKAGLGAFISADDIHVVETATAKTVTATASMTAGTFFMKMVGIDRLSAPAAGIAEESLSDVEISLVLDVSGSMGSTSASGHTKMYDLIQAANEFVYLMQCDPDAEQPFDNVCVVESDTVSISLIPYAEQVLVGETLLQEFNITNEHSQSSCVDFEAADFQSTSVSLTDTLQRAGTIDRRSYHSNGNHGSSSRFARDNYRTCRTDSYRTIVPYSNDYSDLQTQISAMHAGGYTSIHLGMKWATALLDPEFQPALSNLTTGASPLITPNFDGRPYSYGRPRTKKVVVLMTDGKNTSLYSLKPGFRTGLSPFWLNDKDYSDDNDLSVYRASTNKYYHVHGDYSSRWRSYPHGNSGGDDDAVQLTYQEVWDNYAVDYWDDEFWWLADSWNYIGNSTMNTYLDNICDTAKARGIEVFTLGFETSSSSSAVLSSCASSVSHHFDVDGTDISEAFNSIAREIHDLRLTN
ncbi:MAG: pilus assembly protein TadG-related protein [Paracoccaceae bacterium]